MMKYLSTFNDFHGAHTCPIQKNPQTQAQPPVNCASLEDMASAGCLLQGKKMPGLFTGLANRGGRVLYNVSDHGTWVWRCT